MLPGFIIEEILKREREKERKRGQPIPLELPVENPMSRIPDHQPEKTKEPAEIDILDRKDEITTNYYFSISRYYS
ncbi:MAG TPA: hypothetical protein VJA18_05020 [Candidatus Nanoarchaeia archaeon]|nr:hypothetical protein [Candidatus Nanoarchaeia archaeon]